MPRTLLFLALFLCVALAAGADGRSWLLEVQISGLDVSGIQSYDDLPWASGLSFIWLDANGPSFYAGGSIIYMGGPVYGYQSSLGLSAKGGLLFPIQLGEGGFVAPDLGIVYRGYGWKDYQAYSYDYTYNWSSYFFNTGSVLDIQARAGARIFGLINMEDILIMRMGFAAYLIYGYSKIQNTMYPRSAPTHVYKEQLPLDGSSLGFLAAIEFTGACFSASIGLGYYNGFFMDMEVGLGWIF